MTVFFITAIVTNFAFAQVEVYVQKGGKEFVEKISFNENSFTDSIRINFYCSYIKLFRGDLCVSNKEYNKLNNIGLTKDAPMQNLAMTTPAVVSTPSAPQVIYQVIEKAVPGPQGPAGRDGVDMTNNNSNTIASFFPNTAYGSQYIGYGAGNSSGAVNPTGSGNLSSLSVSGDSSFGGKITGGGLLACNTLLDKILYNATTGRFECGTDQGAGFSGGDLIGQMLYATTSLYSPLLFASTTYATITNAITGNFTNLYAQNFFASTSWATTTFASSSYITDLIATQATFSYATVTNGFFTNLSVTGPVSAALNNGYIFRGGTNNFSEATSTIFVSDSGLVGVGSTTPTEKLSVQGNMLVSGNIVTPKFSDLPVAQVGDSILCISGGGEVRIDTVQDCFGAYSDVNLKKNIATVTSVLEKVGQLNTVNFNWIDEKRGTTTQLGYIAQDVQKVFPEAVKTDNKGFLKVNYLALSAIYANAIKELNAKVESFINRLLAVENKQAELENKVNTLQQRLDTLQGISTPPVELNNWVDTNATGTATTTASTTETVEPNLLENKGDVATNTEVKAE